MFVQTAKFDDGNKRRSAKFDNGSERSEPRPMTNFLSCLQLGAIFVDDDQMTFLSTRLNNFDICATDVFTVFLCDKIGADFGDHAGTCATVDKGLCGVRIASSKSNKTLTMMECKPGKTNNGLPEVSTEEMGLEADNRLAEVSTEEMGLEAELMDTKIRSNLVTKKTSEDINGTNVEIIQSGQNECHLIIIHKNGAQLQT